MWEHITYKATNLHICFHHHKFITRLATKLIFKKKKEKKRGFATDDVTSAMTPPHTLHVCVCIFPNVNFGNYRSWFLWIMGE